jgi:hypothetical protein
MSRLALAPLTLRKASVDRKTAFYKAIVDGLRQQIGFRPEEVARGRFLRESQR